VMQRHSETGAPITLQTLLQLCFFYWYGYWVSYDATDYNLAVLHTSSALMRPVVFKPKDYSVLTS
jgi:hypothetical protein